MKRLARKLGVKPTNDPDGVIAVLEIGKRFVKEGQDPYEAILSASNDYAAPKDSARAFWAAYHALSTHNWDFEEAVKAQGKMKQAMK